MLSLFKPFRLTTKADAESRRARKTPGALYRILRDEFERLRPHECSCKMPMIFECEREAPDEPNWRVETLWCGCLDCQQALADVVAKNARLFDLREGTGPLPSASPRMPPLTQA